MRNLNARYLLTSYSMTSLSSVLNSALKKEKEGHIRCLYMSNYCQMPNVLSYNTYSGKIIFVYLSACIAGFIRSKKFFSVCNFLV